MWSSSELVCGLAILFFVFGPFFGPVVAVVAAVAVVAVVAVIAAAFARISSSH